MKTSIIKPLVLAFSLAFSAGAMAEAMSKIDYKSAEEKISVDYKAAKTACDSMSGNAKDVCVLEAKGKERIATAELEYRFKPTEKNRAEIDSVTAKANYETAKERCDDLSGNAKDVCVAQAKSVITTARADGKERTTSYEAVDKVNQPTKDGKTEGATEKQNARSDAMTEKNKAEYNLAKEKCGSFAGTTKDDCMNRANAQYGR